MTENWRIILNITATYARSLYGLILGLLCGRWALQALGQVDYGLYGLIAGLAFFIAFFNNVLSSANARFYAYSVGQARVAENEVGALEECRRWFNTALSVHTVVPILLIVLGYPLGVYAVEHWLTIPSDRIEACVWVLRFVCLSCFVGMLNVPFSAMFTAKQYIAELTLYSFISATSNVVVLYYMVTHPASWLVKYAAWMCLSSVFFQLVVCVRALYLFPECKIVRRYMWDKKRLGYLGGYSGWQIIGMFCGLLEINGMSIIINKFFGASMNAAQAIGNSVKGQCNTLAGAMQSAFVPAITQACGARDYAKMKKFAMRTCKLNVILFLLFAIPLVLELDQILKLWLKEPPAYTRGLCLCAFLYHLVECCTVGHMVVVNATGKIAAYHIVLGSIRLFTIPLAVGVGLLWRNIYLIMAVTIVMATLNSLGRIVFAKFLTGMPVRVWLREVLVPLAGITLLTFGVGILPAGYLSASFVRVLLSTCCCELIFIPLVWRYSISPDERTYVIEKFKGLRRKICE